jgi:hypothetical protein
MSRSRRHAGCVLGGPLGRDIVVHIAERMCLARSHPGTRAPERLAAAPCPAPASCGSDLAWLPRRLELWVWHENPEGGRPTRAGYGERLR